MLLGLFSHMNHMYYKGFSIHRFAVTFLSIKIIYKKTQIILFGSVFCISKKFYLLTPLTKTCHVTGQMKPFLFSIPIANKRQCYMYWMKLGERIDFFVLFFNIYTILPCLFFPTAFGSVSFKWSLFLFDAYAHCCKDIW